MLNVEFAGMELLPFPPPCRDANTALALKKTSLILRHRLIVNFLYDHHNICCESFPHTATKSFGSFHNARSTKMNSSHKRQLSKLDRPAVLKSNHRSCAKSSNHCIEHNKSQSSLAVRHHLVLCVARTRFLI